MAPRQPYYWRKRWDSVSLQNVKSEEQARVSSSRLFHARAAATGKARSPRVARRVDGTCSVVVSAERKHWRATISDVGRRLSDKYAGAVPCQNTQHTPEHTTGTGFVLWHVTSEAPVAVGCCAMPEHTTHTRTHNRNWIRSVTRNQWSSHSSGVVCSDVRHE